MMEGDGDVVIGWYNKVAAAVANITPAAGRPEIAVRGDLAALFSARGIDGSGTRT